MLSQPIPEVCCNPNVESSVLITNIKEPRRHSHGQIGPGKPKVLSMTGRQNLERGPRRPLSKFWLPEATKAGHWEVSVQL